MKEKKPNTERPFFEMGQRIAEAREKATSLNQRDMAETLKLGDVTYGNYERGTRKMPPDVVERFCKKTGTTADYIYRGIGNPVENLEKILMAFTGANKDGVDEMMNYIDFMKKKKPELFENEDK